MSEYIVDGAEPNNTVLQTRSRNGYELEKWLPVREEIVRCRDCRFSRIFDGKGHPGKKYEGMTYCIAWSDGYQGEWTKPDGFCHKAKKKESDDD